MKLKISYHITFFFDRERMNYLKEILENIESYPFEVDVFLHTNTDVDFKPYFNHKIKIIYHNIENENPFFLSWKYRETMKSQRFDYDIFIYSDDDILIPLEAILYWLEYKNAVQLFGYNLGFFRIEKNLGKEFVLDLPNRKLSKLKKLLYSNYILNNVNPYCGFWILDKFSFNKFVINKKYDLNFICGYETREKSAIGINGLDDNLTKGVLIPYDNSLNGNCKVYHLPNNYIDHNVFSTIEFDDVVDLSFSYFILNLLFTIKILLVRYSNFNCYY